MDRPANRQARVPRVSAFSWEPLREAGLDSSKIDLYWTVREAILWLAKLPSSSTPASITLAMLYPDEGEVPGKVLVDAAEAIVAALKSGSLFAIRINADGIENNISPAFWNGKAVADEPEYDDRSIVLRSDTVRALFSSDASARPAGLDTNIEEPQDSEPLVISAGKMSLPPEGFDFDASTDVAPWWSVVQMLAWVSTRSSSFVEYIGRYQSGGHFEIRPFVCLGILDVQVANRFCRCGSTDDDPETAWENCTCVIRAGWTALEQIRLGSVKPMRAGGGGTQAMAFHEFVGIGQRAGGADWLDLKPSPIFSSAELIAVFPKPAAEPVPLRERAIRERKPPGPRREQTVIHALTQARDECVKSGMRRPLAHGDFERIKTLIVSKLEAVGLS